MCPDATGRRLVFAFTLVIICTCTWCLRYENEGHAMSEWVGAAQSLDSRDSLRDAERLAECRHAAWIACVKLSLVMCSVKRLSCLSTTCQLPGVSCARRMATWQCEDKQRGGGCLVDTIRTLYMTLAWCCSTMAVQHAGVCQTVVTPPLLMYASQPRCVLLSVPEPGY